MVENSKKNQKKSFSDRERQRSSFPKRSESYDSLIFDLDGTLWNTTETCARAWNLGINRLGYNLPAITDNDIASVTGLPYEECMRRTFRGFSEEQMQEIFKTLGDCEEELILIEGGTLYDGVREGLKALSVKYPLFLVSNCREWYLDRFLSWSGFSSLFIDSESYGRTLNPKHDNIMAVKKRNQLENPVYIGDTEDDFEAATLAELDFIQVSYGFGPEIRGVPNFARFTDLLDFFL